MQSFQFYFIKIFRERENCSKYNTTEKIKVKQLQGCILKVDTMKKSQNIKSYHL